MRFHRSSRVGAYALALVLTSSLPMSGQAQAASPPIPALGPRAGNEFVMYLNAAVQLYENLEYEEALEKLERAKSYVSDIKDDVSISLYKGIILADLGQQEQSRVAFRAGLLLNPNAQLPLKVSPKVTRDFEALRDEVHREMETLGAKQAAQQSVAATKEPPGPSPVSFAPGAVTAAPPPRSRVLPYSLLGGGAVMAGAGVALGVSARSFNERKRELTADEAVLERDKASKKLTIGTVLMGGGLAALGTGVVLLLMPQGTKRPDTSPPDVSLQLTLLPGTLALGATSRF